MAINYFQTLLNSNKNEENERTSELSGKVNSMYGQQGIQPITSVFGEPLIRNTNGDGVLSNLMSNPQTVNPKTSGVGYVGLNTFSDSIVSRNKVYIKDLLAAQRAANNGSKGAVTPEITFNANADESSLGNLDVTTELPKLNSNQIKDIISTYFSKSTVITPSDAEGIYKAQQSTGMSALAILGIGALESGYGTSNIAKKKGNIWGWGATNSNPMGNAQSFSQMSQGASEFANAYLKTYYNGYGAKSINSAGTGNNPSKKGYAYNDDGTINSSWATSVSSIMSKFYQTAKKSATDNGQSNNNQNSKQNTKSNKVGTKVADISGYNNSAAKGQCVWFVRGRMKQLLGKDTGSLGNANQMWYNAKDSAKLAPTEANIKPNTIASYKTGLSAAGKKYGHVIYIEDVVGDTVYYTEGGSYYYNNGTIGTLKTASKKDILNGSSKFGYGLIGFIDAANY